MAQRPCFSILGAFAMRRWPIGLLLLVFAFSARADDTKKTGADTYKVPFTQTETKHVLIRAKINGKGPYNFIMDTGAPALFVSTAVCKKLGIEAGKDGWGTFDKFEIEGGAIVDKAQGKIADPFQLEGMNRMGLAGAELHGVIGYNILARYKIELDFTRDKMTWTRLKFDPGLPEGLGDKAPGGVEAMAGLAKLATMFLGKRGVREIRPRGFLGVELANKDDGLAVTAVLKDSPAAEAGLKTGDRITHCEGKEVKKDSDLAKQLASVAAGDSVKLTVVRDKESRDVTITAGKGF
jgi:hypothetical protein